MDQSLKKILHKIWDKYQVYDEKLIRKFLTGYKELDSIDLRNEFRNWLGGEDVVFNKVDEFLSKPKHVRVGGYDFDYKPINWDINVSNNHDMWVEFDSSLVDPNGKVTLDGYDGNTYDIGEVMDGEEFSDEDNIPWEVDDEINDIIKDQLKDLLMKNFGVDLIYYNNLVYDDQAFDKTLQENVSRIKEMMGIITETKEEQKVLHIPSLKFFGLDRLEAWNNLQKFLERKGNPPYSIGGDLDLSELPIESLGNIVSVDGNLDLYNTQIKSLGKLKSVSGDVILRNTFIDSVGELTSVGGHLNLDGLPITSLGNLKSVGGDLFMYRTPIQSLGNLKFVGGDLYLRNTPLSKMYTKKEISEMINVGGGIHL